MKKKKKRTELVKYVLIFAGLMAAAVLFGRWQERHPEGPGETAYVAAEQEAQESGEEPESGEESDSGRDEESSHIWPSHESAEEEENLPPWYAEDSQVENPVSAEVVFVSKSTVESDPESIPPFDGADYVELNGNKPNFIEEDFQGVTGEHFTPLDSLGRCGTAYAVLDYNLIPHGDRGSIGSVKPSGMKQAKYPGCIDSDPPFLYNRSHLIAHGLSGQNANELNLIAGTHYMNATSMLPFEEAAMQYEHYTKYTHTHLLYRVTPYFAGDELVARGVEMEAYSVEDHGAELCYHVFVYNYQPGIEIDYRDGSSRIAGDLKKDINIVTDDGR